MHISLKHAREGDSQAEVVEPLKIAPTSASLHQVELSEDVHSTTYIYS